MTPIERAQTILQRLISQQIRLQSARAARAVSEFSGTLKEVSSEVASRRENPMVRRLAGPVSDALDQASHYLSETHGDRIFEDLEAYATEQPIIATAAAALAAFLAARIFKVSLLVSE